MVEICDITCFISVNSKSSSLIGSSGISEVALQAISWMAWNSSVICILQFKPASVTA